MFKILVSSLAIAACSSNSAEPMPDAAPVGSHDAAVVGHLDAALDAAPVGPHGFGQRCAAPLLDAPDCVPSAPNCVEFAGTAGLFCSPACVTNGTGTTNASGQLITTTPPPDTAGCVAAYGGTIAKPACALLVNWAPLDMPLKPNMTYTGIEAVCALRCGTGNTCDPGMTCNTTTNACIPD